jgi:hypothetical protein
MLSTTTRSVLQNFQAPALDASTEEENCRTIPILIQQNNQAMILLDYVANIARPSGTPDNLGVGEFAIRPNLATLADDQSIELIMMSRFDTGPAR